MSCLHENMKMADESAHQLVQCNMRIHSLERECASKEDMIQKITLEKERDKKFAEQVYSYLPQKDTHFLQALCSMGKVILFVVFRMK